MANNNYSIVSGDIIPDDAGTLVQGAQWGIDSELSGFIIQSEDVNKELVTD